MKKCTKCGIEKPLDQFYKNNGKCKPCYIAQYADKRAAYRIKNKKKDALTKALYYQANKGAFAARVIKRRRSCTTATPSWADPKLIQSYYDVAAFFNEINGYVKYHVDHIIPIQGKKVSGLHVHTNLRVILASENIRKKNRFEI